MLLGSYEVRIDEKNRIAVPKRFREMLGTKLIIARWYEKCLVVIDTTGWNKIVGKITGGEVGTLFARDTDRFLLAGSFEVELDHQGRFVVQQVLKIYAKINVDVICVGLGNRIEIWDKNIWIEREKAILLEAGALAENLFEQQRKGE